MGDETGETAASLSQLKRRRGTVKGSITRVATTLAKLKAEPSSTQLLINAQELAEKLKSLDKSFKRRHDMVVDALPDDDALDEALAREQIVYDEQDAEVSRISSEIQQIIRLCSAATEMTPFKRASRYLQDIDQELSSISEQVMKIARDDPSNIHLVKSYLQKISDLGTSFSDTKRLAMSSCTTEEMDELTDALHKISTCLFDCGLNLRKLCDELDALSRMHTPSSVAPAPAASKNIRLAKLETPKFDGEVLHWRTFWDQFKIAIHDRSDLNSAEKMAYLRQSLADGTAKGIIAGLSHTGNQYDEAVECLTEKYDQPRTIHRAHVKALINPPSMKSGSSRELTKVHENFMQHWRALKLMGEEDLSSFLTACYENFMDDTTRIEWRKEHKDVTKTPNIEVLMKFLNERAQAIAPEDIPSRKSPKPGFHANVNKRSTDPVSYVAHPSLYQPSCVVCGENHRLYLCSKFKGMPQDRMAAMVTEHNLCFNCLQPGHSAKQCTSSHRCRKCQKLHHTLIHSDQFFRSTPPENASTNLSTTTRSETVVSSNVATEEKSTSLLMTCQVLVQSPNGNTIKARALLDTGSTVSLVTERIAQSLRLHRTPNNVTVAGVAGSTGGSSRSTVSLQLSPLFSPNDKMSVTALTIQKITSELPLQPVIHHQHWKHIKGLQLADPQFNEPGRVDILLGIDVCGLVMLDGRRVGPTDTPSAWNTKFGWVLAGRTRLFDMPTKHEITCHISVPSTDTLLRKFWEIEEAFKPEDAYSLEEKAVVQHFKDNHRRLKDGTFVIPLPKKPDAKSLGESRYQAVRRFTSLEKSLRNRKEFEPFAKVVKEYFTLGHAEPVPSIDMDKETAKTFYLPMHAVKKEQSTTTKLRVVFDASAKTSTGVSLNDTLMIGPTVHPPLIDVLLRFRCHRVALSADVSKMYRAVKLVPEDKDLHRFVWRENTTEPLIDYRMTRITFGVSASSFAANMSLKQNAQDLAHEYPLAAKIAFSSFYVDDCLTGADTVAEAINIQKQLQSLFSRGGFLLRKWHSSDPAVLNSIPSELKDPDFQTITIEVDPCTKALGIVWNHASDTLSISISSLDPSLPSQVELTKRMLVSDVAKTFDVLGWFSPVMIIAKILLQRCWEQNVDWDDSLPSSICDAWCTWKSELHLLAEVRIPRCYSNCAGKAVTLELHGFCDASESAYAAVIYLRATSRTLIQSALVISKAKVAPLKRQTIPRLELCGAKLLAQLLHHTSKALEIPLSHVHAWCDSTIVLSWLDGSPRKFKTFVGNRVSAIVDLIPPSHWKYVPTGENPADCASRGLLPSELITHHIWWKGPKWLQQSPDYWPHYSHLPITVSEEERDVTLIASSVQNETIFPLDRYSDFKKLKRVTARIMRFTENCRNAVKRNTCNKYLTTSELLNAEHYWLKAMQHEYYLTEITSLEKKKRLSRSSSILSLHPFLDSVGLLRVGGRRELSNVSYDTRHPIILSGKHPIVKSLIWTEHQRLSHAGPTLLAASLSQHYHIVRGRNTIRAITRSCVTCRKSAMRPRPQLLGQLPVERITPSSVFDKVGVDYAGPLLVKHGYVRKPTVVKTYICVFVCLAVKAVHLELVSDLTTEAFLSCLRRFVSRRGLPTLIWSDNGTNFVGADREIKELYHFLEKDDTQQSISRFLTDQKIEWKFNPPSSPHFGGLWEAAVKSTKRHLKTVTRNMKLTFEEAVTILSQIEACLNSRPLTTLPDSDSIEALTPGHFLIGKPLQALPDEPGVRSLSISLPRRWQLCQTITQHFWQRWSNEYLTLINRFTKWHHPSRNLSVGDIVILQEDHLVPTKWPLGKVVEIHPGKDKLVRVATVKTVDGKYKRPVTRLAILLPADSESILLSFTRN